jgi:hypothetical protein
MTSLVGVPVDQSKNPTDTLVKFSNGPSNGWLGLSAKSTKGKTDIGFKNPGIGTIDKQLNIKLSEYYKKKLDEIIKNLKLPTTATSRKTYIISNKLIKEQTEKIGTNLLSEMRDVLYNKLVKMKKDEIFQHIINDWMNADVLYPPYIKVTGKGNKPPYSADVIDPINNKKLNDLSTLKIKIEKVGNDSIGIKANESKIMKMRLKFESEKMASSVKMSGESW